MRKIFQILFQVIFINSIATGQPAFQWVRSAGGNNLHEITGLAVDHNDFIYAGEHSILHKYLSDGTWQWSKPGFGEINAVSVDAQNNILLGGFFSGQIIIDSDTLTSAGNYDMWLAKVDVSGNRIWAKRFGIFRTGAHTDEEGINDIAIDAAGNIYITGWFIDSTQIGTCSLHAHGDSDFFVAKLDANGNCQWARNGGTNLATACAMGDRERGVGIALDDSLNVYVCGRTAGGTVMLGNLSATSVDALVFDAMVAKLDNNGTPQWLKVYSSTQWDEANELTKVADGIVVCGYVKASVPFGPFTATAAAATEAGFIVKIFFSGTEQWLKNFVGTEDNSPLDLESDAAGNIYCTGRYAGSVTIESNSISTPTLNPNVFVLSYTSNGSFRWLKTGGGIYDDWANETALLSNSDVIIGGLTWTPSTYGSLTTSASGYLLARISDPSNPPLGLDNILNTNYFNMYPNPVADRFTIESYSDAIASVEIYDAIGEKLFSFPVSVDSKKYLFSINTSGFSSGIYFIIVRDEKKNSVTRKIIKL